MEGWLINSLDKRKTEHFHDQVIKSGGCGIQNEGHFQENLKFKANNNISHTIFFRKQLIFYFLFQHDKYICVHINNIVLYMWRVLIVLE